MAKLIILALAFTALVAFASAHSTIVSTTLIEEENRSQQQQQCSQQIQGERVNQCQRYLQQGQSWFDNRSQQQQQGDIQSCCQELQNFQGQCQCEAVQEAFRQAAQKVMQQQGQQQQQQQQQASQQIRQLMQKAQNLPDQCSLQTRQCQVGPISITTTTTTITQEEENPQQMCQHIRQRQFNQCRNYVQQQQQRGSTFLSFNRQGQQQQGLQQCCNELQNVEQQCQCEAMQEVYRQAQQQQMQQQRGGQQQDLQQIVQNLRNQCNLKAQQCQIPYTMF